MYRGKIVGSIRDHLETLYSTNEPLDTSGWTNQHTMKLSGSLDLGELVDGLSLDLAYLHYWFVEEPRPGIDDEIGNEVNLKLAYDYTEDVQFILDGAWFMPGNYYEASPVAPVGDFALGGLRGTNATGRTAQDTAVSIVGSCKVTF